MKTGTLSFSIFLLFAVLVQPTFAVSFAGNQTRLTVNYNHQGCVDPQGNQYPCPSK